MELLVLLAASLISLTMFLVLTRTGRAWLSGTLVAAFKEAGDTARSEIVKMFGKAVVIVPVALVAGVTVVEVSEDQVETDRIEAETQRLLAFPEQQPADTVGLGLSAGFNGSPGPVIMSGGTASYTPEGAAADGSCPSYSGVDPFFEWNPNDYADRAALISASVGATPDSVDLLTGQTLFDGSTGNVYAFFDPPGASAQYANLAYNITGASSSATDTIWVEFYYRVSEGANTSSDNKFYEIGTNDTRILPHLNPSGVNGWTDLPASSPHSTFLYANTTDAIFGQSGSRNAILFGGSGSNGMSTWKRGRMYIADESGTGGDGTFLLKVDSIMLYFNESSPPGDSVGGLEVINYNAGFSHATSVWPNGANMGWNEATTVRQDAGPTCIFTENPGWSWVNGSDGLLGPF